MLFADYWLARWGLAQLSRMDQRQDQQIAKQEPWMHIPLSRPVVWATSPCPSAAWERADGSPYLRALQDIRFPLPVAGGLWANALSLRGQLTLELAGPHRFAAHGSPAAQDGAVGQRV